jgi:hypothetical protein
MQSKILAHLQLHPVNFREETGRRKAVRQWIGLDPAEMGELGLETPDALLRRLQLLIVMDHDFASIISTMPRDPPPRFTCQYSTDACSPSFPTRQPPQPEHASAEVGLCGQVIEESTGFAGQVGWIKTVFHHKKDVHIVRFHFVRHKRPEYNKSTEVPRCAGDSVNSLKTQTDGNSLC